MRERDTQIERERGRMSTFPPEIKHTEGMMKERELKTCFKGERERKEKEEGIERKKGEKKKRRRMDTN